MATMTRFDPLVTVKDLLYMLSAQTGGKDNGMDGPLSSGGACSSVSWTQEAGECFTGSLSLLVSLAVAIPTRRLHFNTHSSREGVGASPPPLQHPRPFTGRCVSDNPLPPKPPTAATSPPTPPAAPRLPLLEPPGG